MRRSRCLLLGLFLLVLVSSMAPAASREPRIIHVFVALCDNEHQGIVPVPSALGNGDDPDNNLYWGAAYGVKTFFKKSPDWVLISTTETEREAILERCIFKHRKENVFMVADAYRGREIKKAVTDFIRASSGQDKNVLTLNNNGDNLEIYVGGGAGLLVYVGHNGLMDFGLGPYPDKKDDLHRDVIILACASKPWFSDAIQKTGADPLLWTTGLLAPEAYTLKAAIDGWIKNHTGREIRLAAAGVYSRYQKCSLQAAQKLLVTGW